LSPWAPGGRGPRCLAPAEPMVVMPLLIAYNKYMQYTHHHQAIPFTLTVWVYM